MASGAQPIVWPGRPYPLGATWDGEGVNFALYSEHAEKVELCLFDELGKRETTRVALPEQTDMVWHGYLPEVRPGQLYGYRAYGPYAPEQGQRFNPNKLLLDPYGKQTLGTIHWSDSHFGYKVGHKQEDLSFDRRDNAAGMPKNRVIDSAFTWGTDAPPRIPWHKTLIYELHVKGFTMCHPDVPAHLRGTYAGLATAPIIDYLTRLGVTSIELMPVHSFVDDRQLVERGLRNYWGYNSIGFFALEPRYLATKLDQRIQDHGEDFAFRGTGSDSRRGLQPHRRRQSSWPHIVVERHRQQHVLPSACLTIHATTWITRAPETR